MNTLKYKVLLSKTVLVIFVRAIGIYLLMTLPVIAALPVMYKLSALYAASFGCIAAALFLGFFYLLQKLPIDSSGKYSLLCIAVVVAVGIAFQMMEITGVQHNIWQSGPFLFFPVVAIISGWLSVLASRNKIKMLFSMYKNEYSNTRLTSTSSTNQNII